MAINVALTEPHNPTEDTEAAIAREFLSDYVFDQLETKQGALVAAHHILSAPVYQPGLVHRDPFIVAKEVRRADGLIKKARLNLGSDEMITAADDTAAIIREWVEPRVSALADTIVQLPASIRFIRGNLDRTEKAPDAGKAEELPHLAYEFAKLLELAAKIPHPASLDQLAQALKAESHMLGIASISFGIPLDPENAAKREESIHKALHQTKNSSDYMESRTDFKSVSRILAAKGKEHPHVKENHRDGEDITSDQEAVDAISKDVKLLPSDIKNLEDRIRALARSISQYEVPLMIDVLVNAAYINKSTTEERFADPGMDDTDTMLRALAIERYIASHANTVHKAAQAARVKLDLEQRGTVRELMNTPLSKSLQSVEAHPASSTQIAAEVVVDPDFRRACKDAKDILRGGGRIDYEGASDKARQMHNLVFDSKTGLRFEQAESGVVIAILAEKMDALFQSLQRMSDGADPQVQKFKAEQTETYGMITGFNLEKSIERIHTVLSDYRYRNKLDNVLRPNETQKLQAEVARLQQVFANRVAAEAMFSQMARIFIQASGSQL